MHSAGWIVKTHNLTKAQLKRKLQAAVTSAVPVVAPKTSPPDDKSLFLAAMQGVKPLKNSQRHHGAMFAKKQAIAKAKTKADKELYLRKQQHAVGSATTLPALHGISDHYSADYSEAPQAEYLNPLCGTDVLRNLKKDRWGVMASIDLHGATLEKARLRLEYFLQHSLAEGYKCVRIVHGVGYGSKDSGPVLPTAVRRWLCQLDFVLAYTDCPPREGGNGAVKVLLRL